MKNNFKNEAGFRFLHFSVLYLEKIWTRHVSENFWPFLVAFLDGFGIQFNQIFHGQFEPPKFVIRHSPNVICRSTRSMGAAVGSPLVVHTHWRSWTLSRLTRRFWRTRKTTWQRSGTKPAVMSKLLRGWNLRGGRACLVGRLPGPIFQCTYKCPHRGFDVGLWGGGLKCLEVCWAARQGTAES